MFEPRSTDSSHIELKEFNSPRLFDINVSCSPWQVDCSCTRFKDCIFNSEHIFVDWSDTELHRYYIHINKVIRASGKFNYEFCKFPVPTHINVNLLDKLLNNYHDRQIIQFIKYGWPIEAAHAAESGAVPANQTGARNSPAELHDYLSKEKSQASIIGPFRGNPFGRRARISPLDAIPKKDSDDKRVILNLSHPDGEAVNDAVSKSCYLGRATDLHFPTIDDLANLILKWGVGVALFKVDLKKYYRQIHYDPGCIHLFGFRVGVSFYWDVTLSMGLRIACYITQRLSSAIIFVFNSNVDGAEAVNYIDDLAGVALWSKAYSAFSYLVDLLSKLGLWESVPKRVPPDVVLVFLGIKADSVQLLLKLTDTRLLEIKNETGKWLEKSLTSKKDLQRLIGKLSFAAGTVRSGRLFFSRILSFMKVCPKHGIRPIPSEVKRDILWWNTFMTEYDGVSLIHELGWRDTDSVLSTDACLTGLGGRFGAEYFHCAVPPWLSWDDTVHINELECAAVVIAIKAWANKLGGLNIVMQCDNESTCHVINSGKAKNEYTQACLREITYLSGQYSFQIRMQHVPGEHNRISDYLSRWDLDPKYKDLFFEEISKTEDVTKIKQVLISEAHFAFSHSW